MPGSHSTNLPPGGRGCERGEEGEVGGGRGVCAAPDTAAPGVDGGAAVLKGASGTMWHWLLFRAAREGRADNRRAVRAGREAGGPEGGAAGEGEGDVAHLVIASMSLRHFAIVASIISSTNRRYSGVASVTSAWIVARDAARPSADPPGSGPSSTASAAACAPNLESFASSSATSSSSTSGGSRRMMWRRRVLRDASCGSK